MGGGGDGGGGDRIISKDYDRNTRKVKYRPCAKRNVKVCLFSD